MSTDVLVNDRHSAVLVGFQLSVGRHELGDFDPLRLQVGFELFVLLQGGVGADEDSAEGVVLELLLDLVGGGSQSWDLVLAGVDKVLPPEMDAQIGATLVGASRILKIKVIQDLKKSEKYAELLTFLALTLSSEGLSRNGLSLRAFYTDGLRIIF